MKQNNDIKLPTSTEVGVGSVTELLERYTHRSEKTLISDFYRGVLDRLYTAASEIPPKKRGQEFSIGIQTDSIPEFDESSKDNTDYIEHYSDLIFELEEELEEKNKVLCILKKNNVINNHKFEIRRSNSKWSINSEYVYVLIKYRPKNIINNNQPTEQQINNTQLDESTRLDMETKTIRYKETIHTFQKNPGNKNIFPVFCFLWDMRHNDIPLGFNEIAANIGLAQSAQKCDKEAIMTVKKTIGDIRRRLSRKKFPIKIRMRGGCVKMFVNK